MNASLNPAIIQGGDARQDTDPKPGADRQPLADAQRDAVAQARIDLAACYRLAAHFN